MNKLKCKSGFAGLILLSILAGCASPGGALDPEPFATVKEGVSTRQEVEKTFGAPKTLVRGDNGDYVIGYDAMSGSAAYRSTGADFNYRYRVISFLCGNDDVVRRKLFSESWGVVEGRRGRPLQAGNPLGVADIERVAQKGVDRADLIQVFGKPSWENLVPSGGSLIVWEAALQNYQPSLPGEIKSDEQRVTVLLDPAGKVVDYSIRGLLNGKEQGLPAPPIDPAKPAKKVL